MHEPRKRATRELFANFLLALALAAPSAAAAPQVLSEFEIGRNAGGFTGFLPLDKEFGRALATLEDLDGNGVRDLAVGHYLHTSVWVLLLEADGTVGSQQRLSPGIGGLGDDLGINDVIDLFGWSVASLGDLDGDGTGDLMVGEPNDDNDGDPFHEGAAWILFLNPDGTVETSHKLSPSEGVLAGVVEDESGFGWSIACLGDLDGDGVVDVAVGAPDTDDGAILAGAVWILFLNADGTVKAYQKISATEGGLTASLDASDAFGYSLAALGDVDGDGVTDLGVGSPTARPDAMPGPAPGAVWVLLLNSDGTVKADHTIQYDQGCVSDLWIEGDSFGESLTSLGDVGGGRTAIAVGANHDDGDLFQTGAVWLLELDPDGTLHEAHKVSDEYGEFSGDLPSQSRFGTAVAYLGDLNGDGAQMLAVGTPRRRGRVWMLSLVPLGPGIGTSYCTANANSSGSVASLQVLGSDVASDDLLTLIADCVPRNKLGYFLMGSGQNTFTPPGSAGHFCIGGGQIIRLLPSASNSMDLGTFSHSIGTTSLPIVGQISAGQTWNFQAWFRDRGSSSNMTDAISVTFQ